VYFECKNIIKAASIIVATVGFLVLATWATHRYAEYKRLKPLYEGISAFKKGNYRHALKQIKPFAKKGNHLAMELLGEMYAFGLGVRKDETQARIWIQRSYCKNKNYGETEYYIALDYLDDNSSPNLAWRDTTLALKWLQYSAQSGYRMAQELLANPQKASELGLNIPNGIYNYWKKVASNKNVETKELKY